MIARLPAMKFMRDEYTYLTFTVYWHDYFVPLAELLLPSNERLKHEPLSTMPKQSDIPLIDFDPNRLTSLALHLVDHASLTLMDRLMPMEARKYLQAPKCITTPRFTGSRTVIITCGHTAKVREWPGDEINKTVVGLIRRGYTPIFLGDDKPKVLGNKQRSVAEFDSKIDRTNGIDLIGQTTLLEALALIQQSSCVMGVDNGLLHLASCTKTPVIWGFTSVEQNYRLPPFGTIGIVTPDKGSCYGCQSKCFAVQHDFTKCMFGDYKCTTEMTSDKFLKQFDDLKHIGAIA